MSLNYDTMNGLRYIVDRTVAATNVVHTKIIYILAAIILILLFIIFYLVKKLAEEKIISSITAPSQNNLLPLNYNQLQNYNQHQLQNYNQHQLQNYNNSHLMLRANPGLPSNYMNTSRNTYNNAPVIEDMY
jgi:hypothetical protein